MKVHLWISLILILLVPNAYSQSISASFSNISIKEGLVGDHVLTIYQDSKGFIWVGTFAGLHRFDGYSFHIFNRSAPPYHTLNMIADNTVYAIMEDQNHIFWIGTDRGLSRYDPVKDQFTNYYPDKENPAAGPSHDNIRHIYEDAEGMLWLATYGGGLNRFNPATETFYHYKNDSTPLPGPFLNDFYVDKNGRYWIGTEDNGLVLFNREQETFTYYLHDPNDPNSLSNNVINKIIEDKYGKLWVGTWGGGACRFDLESEAFTCYEAQPGASDHLQNDVVRSLLEDTRGRLWMATFGGGLSLYNREADTFTNFQPEKNNASSLATNLLWEIYEDRDGLIWIGTYGSGLDILDPMNESFAHYGAGEGRRDLSGTQVNALCETRDGTVWIGTIDGGIDILSADRKRVTRFEKDAQLSSATIRSIFEDSEGRLWIGTDLGLYFYTIKSDRLKRYYHDPNNPQSLGKNGVYAIMQDSEGSIWAGTWDTGLNRLARSEYMKEDPAEAEFRHYTAIPGDSNTLSSNRIWDIYEDGNGNIWCGTENGLDKLDPETGAVKHMAALNAGCIIEGEAGILWVGAYGEGVVRFDTKNNKVTSYNNLRNVDINLVLDMVLDDEGFLWICSIDGMTRFNMRTEEFVNLDLSTELKKNEYAINIIEKLSTGEYIIGGDYGLDIFDPDKIRIQGSVPVVELTDFLVFNKSITSNDGKNLEATVPYSEEVNLSYRDNLMSIEFANLYYSSQEQQWYAYKLDGFDEEWTYTRSDNRKATYTNLDPGSYTFRVKGATREGTWSKERTLRINIAPPFWDTLLFKAAMAFMAVLILGLIFRNRVRHERKRILWQTNADKMQHEQEIIRLRNEKLDAELEHKKKELASSTLHNMHRNEELNQVSSELKTILGKLKGNPEERRIKKLVETIDYTIKDADNWEHFEKNFNLLHEDFLQRLMEAYPRLTHKDLKICAFIRMNFDNKEIARMLNITPKSLGVSRTRIRRKIDIDKNIFLNDFIMRF
ncbi:two-component regulator propeller domain-containing protein [Roseivirga sp. BDSF3-8]|uniref:two-component regulator propeller domain-containing protein n=1 Tax=Roseivirga sp. BDSF3-8 TaxID=3241598 RepID=UPI0035322C36